MLNVSKLMFAIMIAIVGVTGGENLLAQCGGGGCGGCGGCGDGGCGGGGCGGCGGGNKAERVDKPNGGGCRGGCPCGEEVNAPDWQKPSSESLEGAAANKQALVIFFPGEAAEQNKDSYFAGKEIKALSAMFVKIAYNSDREAAPNASETLVPTSKILSDNPSRDYKVGTYPCFIVADCYGNEFYRIEGKKPTAKELTGYIGEVTKKSDEINKKLSKNLEAAKKAWEGKDFAKTLTSLKANFKGGMVGLDAQNESIRLYHEVIEAGRANISEADAKKLKEMKNTFKGTELEKEIGEALKGAKS